jgi:hypothetical protein
MGCMGAHAVAEKAEWDGHQRRQNVAQLLHEGAHARAWRLVDARSATGQLHRTEIDLGGHAAPQRLVKRSASRCVRKQE